MVSNVRFKNRCRELLRLMGLVFLREEDDFVQLVLMKPWRMTQEKNDKPYPFTQMFTFFPKSTLYNTTEFRSLLYRRQSFIFSHWSQTSFVNWSFQMPKSQRSYKDSEVQTITYKLRVYASTFMSMLYSQMRTLDSLHLFFNPCSQTFVYEEGRKRF